jgi:hypothetical protein
LHPQSYINKLTDVLYSFDRRLGETLKASPSHYIVIENIASDKQDDWEMYDLKPPTYLEPFRDLLPERVQMSGVTDILPKDVKVFVSREERERMLEQFRIDTEFLARLGAVDYSVLLIRLPDGSARWALIDIFWSLREPRAKLTKYASDTGTFTIFDFKLNGLTSCSEAPATDGDSRCGGIRTRGAGYDQRGGGGA